MKFLVLSRFVPLLFVFILIAGMFYLPKPSTAAAYDFKGQDLIAEWAKKEYQGRQAGTAGYSKAVTDLQTRMISAGMLPAFGESEYRQSFKTGTAIFQKESVTINNKPLKLMKDYMPFSRSASGAFSFKNLYYAGAGTKNDYPTKVDGMVVFHWYDKQGRFPEGALDRIQRAVDKGAKGVMIITNGELKVGNYEHPLNDQKLNVPVLYISEEVAADLGVTGDYTPAALKASNVVISLKIDRSVQTAENLVGVIPGKNEQKSILWVTNIDGFGSLPDGRWYESAKSGAAAAAMMIDMARYYKENTPEYTMIFAFVGGKWKQQEGIQALASKLNFDHITYTVDLYAMGGDGNLNSMYIGYTDSSFTDEAKAVSGTAQLNIDLGNSLSSVLKNKTNRLFMVRDRNTWLDDSLSDKAASISPAQYKAGTNSLLSLSDRMMAIPSKEADYNYSKSVVSKVNLQTPKVTLNQIESKYFTIYADDSNISLITPVVLKEMDSIYNRVAMYNYYPVPAEKVTALFMDNGELAAQISGRKDLEKNSAAAGGGFANVYNDRMYIYMRNGWTYGTIAHELNHALATSNPYAGDNFELQEWQGQSHFVRYMMANGQLVHPESMKSIIQNDYLSNHEVPKLKEMAANYTKSLDWSWYTNQNKNPNGHLYTYYLMGSMYAFLKDQYGEETSRRAMYRNYVDVSNIQNNLIKDTGLSLDSFLKAWSSWLVAGGNASHSNNTVLKKGNNSFDYMMLYVLPDKKISGDTNESVTTPGTKKTNGTVNYQLDVSSNDLNIRSLNIYKTKDGASVEINYESKEARFVSLFDPPNGNQLNKFLKNGIVPGKGKVTLKLNSKEVKTMLKLPMVTLRFGEGEDFAYIVNEEFIKILK